MNLPPLPEFSRFFTDLWGPEVAPFPWQRRMSDQLVSTGRWPDTLSLPTASGKTAALEIAVYHLASQAELARDNTRTAPRRIFFIVDRRVVADEAFERSRKLASKLANPTTEALRSVRARLLHFGQISDSPLHTVLLRGGVYRDNFWVQNPLQPTICVSTVDQLGSRLLFRGYGVSKRSWPIHAALAAHDCLYLLDEAHLSNPFAQTLTAIKESLAQERAKWSGAGINWSTPFSYCRMSATPGETENLFQESPEDYADPILSRRLTNPKLVSLRSKKTKRCTKQLRPDERRNIREENRALIVEEAIACSMHLAHSVPGKNVCLLFNTVAAARLAENLLSSRGQRSILLTGRSRPFDREQLFLSGIGERLRSGSGHTIGSEETLFVCATQCLEAGTDFDFAAMVTEAASLDALRQRFGRLNRQGNLETAHGVILVGEDQLTAKDDFLYGPALSNTWKTLSSHARKMAHPADSSARSAVVDVSHANLRRVLDSNANLSECLSPKPDSPLLLGSHLEAFSQTNPEPAASPDVALFLHGPETGPADVQVVWRANLTRDNQSQWADLVCSLRPISSEALPLPRHILLNWLACRFDLDVADVEAAATGDNPQSEKNTDFPAVLVNGRSDEYTVLPSDQFHRIRPGDTVVLPAIYGGCDAYGWSPGQSVQTTDVAEAAHLHQRGELVLRINADSLSAFGIDKEAVATLLLEWDEDALADRCESLRAILEQSANDGEGWRRKFLDASLDALADSHSWREVNRVWNDAGVLIQVVIRHFGATPQVSGFAVNTTDFLDDDQIAHRNRTLLAQHSDSVAKCVRVLAEGVGLPSELVHDLELAAALHDLGKGDPRFQNWIGNYEVSELWAKSQGALRDGLPRGARHEALSVQLAASSDFVRSGANDLELVLHLISSHHGHSRPFFIPVPGETERKNVAFDLQIGALIPATTFSSATGPHLYSLTNGVADRFGLLQSKYGRYHLAFLEAFLRLSDWLVSSAGH